MQNTRRINPRTARSSIPSVDLGGHTTMKHFALTALLACGLAGHAGAATVFSANFEDGGTDADIGTLTHSVGNVSNVGTSAAATDLGSNVMLVDQSTSAIDFELDFADLSLAGTNTVSFSFNVAARRTNGLSKTHYVTGYDSNGDEVFQLILGDSNVFGNGGADRQRPGYGTSVDEFVLGSPPNSFWWGSDGNPGDGFNVNVDASFDLTIGNGGWDVSTTSAFAGSFSTTDLPLFNGGTAADLASITITSNGTNAGNYWDNLLIEGTLVPEPSSLALMGLGGLAMIRRRR